MRSIRKQTHIAALGGLLATAARPRAGSGAGPTGGATGAVAGTFVSRAAAVDGAREQTHGACQRSCHHRLGGALGYRGSGEQRALAAARGGGAGEAAAGPDAVAVGLAERGEVPDERDAGLGDAGRLLLRRRDVAAGGRRRLGDDLLDRIGLHRREELRRAGRADRLAAGGSRAAGAGGPRLVAGCIHRKAGDGIDLGLLGGRLDGLFGAGLLGARLLRAGLLRGRLLRSGLLGDRVLGGGRRRHRLGGLLGRRGSRGRGLDRRRGRHGSRYYRRRRRRRRSRSGSRRNDGSRRGDRTRSGHLHLRRRRRAHHQQEQGQRAADDEAERRAWIRHAEAVPK